MVRARQRRQLGRTKSITRSRVAVVGCGRRFASSIEPTLTALKSRIVLIVDPDRRARNRVIGSLRDDNVLEADFLTPHALDESSPDAIIISSPSGLHYQHAMISLSHRIPTFVEKPLACSAADARALSLLGAGLLAISEQRIHRLDIRLARSIIRSRLLGKIHRLTYYDSVAPYHTFKATWRNDQRLAGGGVLLDLGYHTVGAIQWLLQEDTSNFTVAFAEFERAGLRIESEARATCTWGNVEIGLDIRLDQEHPREELTVYGSRAMFRIARDRAGRPVSTITLRTVRRGTLKTHVMLGNRYDSEVLRSFISGGLGAVDRLARHVVTLEFLEQIYGHVTGGIAPCGS